MDGKMSLGSAGPVAEPTKSMNDRPQVVYVSPVVADFQPGRNQEPRGATSPIAKTPKQG